MGLNIKLPADSADVIKSFIKSKLNDAGSTGMVVGLSGGLDSAVVLKLCTDVLGKDKVLVMMMPESKDKDPNYDDANKLAGDLGVKAITIEIEPLIESYCNLWGDLQACDTALANLKARIRATLIYTYANNENRLVAGASNKSELMVGYFTKYGDGASDIAPIGDLYKTQVRMLAGEIEVPEIFISKVPTAGLLPDQTDEGELGITYKILDKILLGLELKYSREKISKTLEISVNKVDNVISLVKGSQHKRELTAIPKIGLRTVGTDLRE
jgi:NAD+ synthase